MNLARDIYLTP